MYLYIRDVKAGQRNLATSMYNYDAFYYRIDIFMDIPVFSM